MPDSETDRSAGTSGKLVIVLIVAGLLLITIVTVVLYFATRQVEEDGTPTPTSISRPVSSALHPEVIGVYPLPVGRGAAFSPWIARRLFGAVQLSPNLIRK